MNHAVFLDRDGVLNKPIFNPNTKEYEAPFKEEDVVLYPGVIDSLKELLKLHYALFLVSNQPDYAKGETNLENLKRVHNKLHTIFTQNNINFLEYYYCYHHPKGTVPEYSIICQCRKPGNLFLEQAKSKYGLDMANSWMIGDRDSDIYCGQSMGTKTILIDLKYLSTKAGQSKPDYKANDLQEAIKIIKEISNVTN